MAATITNIFIIILLIGGIGYGWVISQRIQRLMAVLQELEPAVRDYSDAVEKSEASVTMMRENLDAAEDAAAPQQHDAPQEAAPSFASRREKQTRLPGSHIVRGKQDLVRMFFDASRTESRA